MGKAEGAPSIINKINVGDVKLRLGESFHIGARQSQTPPNN